MRFVHSLILVATALQATALFAQTALNFSTATPTGGTGWAAVSNTTSGKLFIDTGSSGSTGQLVYLSSLPTNGSSSNLTTAYQELSGNLVGGSGSSYTTNPMVAIQTAFIGGATVNDVGLAFQVRLASYDLNSIKNKGGLTVLIGVSPANASNTTDYSTFVIGASITSSNGTSITGSSVFILDSEGSSGVNKASNYAVGSGMTSSWAVAQSSSGLASSYLGYSSTTNDFNAGTATISGVTATDANDALLSFGVKFSEINSGVSALARGNTVLDATTVKWEFAPATAWGAYSGTATKSTSATATTWTIYDGTGTVGNLQASDSIFTNGSTSAGANPPGYAPVPESSTVALIAGLLAPLGFVLRRRRESIAVRAGCTAISGN